MILVIEVTETMRLILSAVLEDWGYSVLTARDAVEGLTMYKKRCPQIRLVISDVVMPRMGTLQMLRQFKALNAGVKVVFACGVLDQDMCKRLASEGAVGFLRKPYFPSDLRGVVSAAIGEPTPS